MRWSLLSAVVVAAGLALGCSGPVDELEGTDDPLVATKPIALHYGFLQAMPYHPDDDPKTVDAHPVASSALIAKGVENVLVTAKPVDPTALGAWQGVAADWKSHGGVLARHTTPSEVVAAVEGAGFTAFVKKAIADGFGYVAVDELEPTKASRLRDGDPAADRVRDELHAMNEDPALRQRVIFYANSYNMVDDLASFTTVLRACRDYCRVFASEVYLGANEAFVAGAVGTNAKTGRRDCANGIDCVGYFANKTEQIAPGIRGRTITVVGVSAAYLPGTSWESSYCWGARGGALRAELAKVRALGQPGIGTYSESAVANDLAGADFAKARDMYAGCLRGLVQEGIFAPVAPARAPDGFVLPPPQPQLPLPQSPTACGRIDPGQGLGPGQLVTSCNGQYLFVMQGDGNLVLYMGQVALWSTQTNGKNGWAAVMQSDGNFVLYGPTAAPLWASKTDGSPGAWFAVQDDGNLVVYGATQVALWSSGTFKH